MKDTEISQLEVNTRVTYHRTDYDGPYGESGFGLVLDISNFPDILILRDDGKIEMFLELQLYIYEDWDIEDQ